MDGLAQVAGLLARRLLALNGRISAVGQLGLDGLALSSLAQLSGYGSGSLSTDSGAFDNEHIDKYDYETTTNVNIATSTTVVLNRSSLLAED